MPLPNRRRRAPFPSSRPPGADLYSVFGRNRRMVIRGLMALGFLLIPVLVLLILWKLDSGMFWWADE